MLHALIFDFDGLILDTETPKYQAWQEVFAAYGCDLPMATWAQAVGSNQRFDPYRYLESLVGRELDHDTLRATTRARFRELLGVPRPLPGVVAYIEAAQRLDMRLAIASSSPRTWIDEHLSTLGLHHHFSIFCTIDDVARSKPDPDLYLLALERLGVSASQALALEDSPNGVRAAQAAGIYSIAVPNPVTAQMDLRHADLVLPSLAAMSLEEVVGHAQTRRSS
ncbi:HAD family hydrolase [Candidatus Oscillochloris fontis]|uniref:HAD family hydrolase n=1 Tax=Candidatus Oscillochloris fontis TaxID=2496868 RepID=UPI00101D8DE9|nr:HAD family hydrolase [Candidatus Oscillochloris fontis]